MGALTQAMARSARAAGVEIRCNAAVSEIVTSNGRATGVRLETGEEIAATRIASSVDAHLTFEKLLKPADLPNDFREAAARIDYSSASREKRGWPAAPRHDPYRLHARLPRTGL
jgi:phytoene dehydrogenase-like protein